MKKTLTIFIALIALSSFAFAQQGAGGQNGQGRGRGQGQAQGQRAQGGGNGIASLLRNPNVIAELNLSEGQKSKIAEILPQRGQGGQGGQGGQRGQGGGQRANGGQQGQGGGQRGQGGQGQDGGANRANQAELEKKIAEILDDTQEVRLAELVIQRAGYRAVFDEKVAAKLELTASQKSQITTLRDKQREAQQILAEKSRNQEISREEARSAREKNETILDAEIGKILTEKQKTDLKALGGKPFSF